jgi:hypothetical protein
MVTQEMKDQVKSFLEFERIYFVETQTGKMYVGTLNSKEENYFTIKLMCNNDITLPILYKSIKAIHRVEDPLEFKTPNIILSKKNDETSKERPPIGIMPKKIWNLQRMNNLKDAIKRYCEASREVPIEWIEEYNSLVEEVNQMSVNIGNKNVIVGKENLKDIPTYKLIEELKTRKGVSFTVVEPYEEYPTKIEGPAIVLKVID